MGNCTHICISFDPHSKETFAGNHVAIVLKFLENLEDISFRYYIYVFLLINLLHGILILIDMLSFLYEINLSLTEPNQFW